MCTCVVCKKYIYEFVLSDILDENFDICVKPF